MAKASRYWRKKLLYPGVVIRVLREKEYVFARYGVDGKMKKKAFGEASFHAIDQATSYVSARREDRRLGKTGVADTREPVRWDINKACQVFWRLHGSQRHHADGTINKKACGQFKRNLGYIDRIWSGRTIDTITDLDVRAYRTKRKREGVAYTTVNREHGTVTTLFNCLTRWKRQKSVHVPWNLMLPETNPGEAEPKESPLELDRVRSVVISKEQFETLYMVADPRLRRILLAEMNAPLSLEDLQQLTKDKVGFVTVTGDGPPRREERILGVRTKSGQEYYIPVNEHLRELIRTAQGNRVLDMSGFRKRWEKARRLAGLKGVEFRDLRRTAATALHMAGHALKVISAMLGHSSVATTERYLGLRAENIHAAGRTLAALFSPPAGTVALDASGKTVPGTVPGVSEIETAILSEAVE